MREDWRTKKGEQIQIKRTKRETGFKKMLSRGSLCRERVQVGVRDMSPPLGTGGKGKFWTNQFSWPFPRPQGGGF